MCDELSGWFYKTRAVEQVRKEQEKAELLREQREAMPVAQPAQTGTRVKEREDVPV